jgi:hypothetical protein
MLVKIEGRSRMNPMSPWPRRGRTLMRPPIVKRQTSPQRGFLLFSAENAWRSSPLAPCSAVIALGWHSAHVAAPHTYGGSTAMAMARAESRATVFCALATSRDPHAVLLNGGAPRFRAPVRFRCGCGAAHRHHPSLAPAGSARAQASNPTHRVGAQGLWALERSSTPQGHHDRARWPGASIVTP